MPATAFFREAIDLVRTGREPASETLDPAFKMIVRKSQCDAQGNFMFGNVPAAAWIVMTQVTWTVGYSPQGGTLVREINVANDENTQILLTDKDFIGR